MKLIVNCGSGKRARYIKAVSEFCIKELGLTNSRFTVIVQAAPKKSKVFACTAHFRKDTLAVLLNIHKIPIPELGPCVVHEFVHVKQFARGLLRHGPSATHVIWRGKLYDCNEVKFSYRPWEIQALQAQSFLIRRYEDQLT